MKNNILLITAIFAVFMSFVSTSAYAAIITNTSANTQATASSHTYNLVVNTNPSACTGMTYPGTGTYSEKAGASVAVSAAAGGGDAGYTCMFTKWVGTGSGSYSGTSQNPQVTMNGDIVETATYQYTVSPPSTYTLTIKIDPTTGCSNLLYPGTGTYTEKSGSSVTVNADPAGGDGTADCLFTNWVGTGTGSYSGTSPSPQVTMKSDIVETATYKATPLPSSTYTLTINTNPSSACYSLVYPAAGTYTEKSGALVAVSAAAGGADSGYTCLFTKWVGTGSGSYSGTSQNPQVTMNGDIVETAEFQTTPIPPSHYSLTINTNPTQCVGLTSPATGVYSEKTYSSVPISAAAGGGDTGYSCLFTKWVGTGTGSYSGTSENPQVTMNSNIVETATFQYTVTPPPPPSEYTITLTSGQGGYEGVASDQVAYTCMEPQKSCTYTYAKGTQLTVYAYSDTGYTTSMISGTGSAACSTTSSSCTLQLNGNVVETSYFQTIPTSPPPVASMSVAYTTSYTSNFTTTMSLTGGDAIYPYNFNIIFQNSAGVTIFSIVEQQNIDYTWYGWRYSALNMLPGQTYTVKTVVTDGNGKYLATSNEAYIYVPKPLPPPTSSCYSITTLYVGQSLACGNYTIELSDLGQPNQSGQSMALMGVYYKGALQEDLDAVPGSIYSFNAGGNSKYINIYVNQTFAGLYEYQKWAKVSIETSANPIPQSAVKYIYSKIPFVTEDQNPLANPQLTAIVVGNATTNLYAAQIFSENPAFALSFGPASVVAMAFGSSRILVAAGMASNVHSAAEQFILDLKAASAANGGPVTFGGIPIINSQGQPVVQIVVGANATLAEWNASEEIASTILNLSVYKPPTNNNICNAWFNMYVGGSNTCGSYAINLTQIYAQGSGRNPAYFDVWYNGQLQHGSYGIYPGAWILIREKINDTAQNVMNLSVNQTYYNQSSQQSVAQVKMSVYTAPIFPTLSCSTLTDCALTLNVTQNATVGNWKVQMLSSDPVHNSATVGLFYNDVLQSSAGLGTAPETFTAENSQITIAVTSAYQNYASLQVSVINQGTVPTDNCYVVQSSYPHLTGNCSGESPAYVALFTNKTGISFSFSSNSFKIYNSTGASTASWFYLDKPYNNNVTLNFSANRWYFMVVNLNYSNPSNEVETIYINGKQTVQASGLALLSTLGFTTAVPDFKYMSNVQGYDELLTQQQISALYSQGLGALPIDLSHIESWYPLDNDTYDHSGNGQPFVYVNLSFASSYNFSAVQSVAKTTVPPTVPPTTVHVPVTTTVHPITTIKPIKTTVSPSPIQPTIYPVRTIYPVVSPSTGTSGSSASILSRLVSFWKSIFG